MTGGVDDRYLEHLEKVRNDNAKSKKRKSIVEEMEFVNGNCNGPMSEYA